MCELSFFFVFDYLDIL